MSQWIYMGASEQHLVNVACRDNWLRLPDKYHVQAGTIHNRKFADDLDDAYVVHFSKIAAKSQDKVQILHPAIRTNFRRGWPETASRPDDCQGAGGQGRLLGSQRIA